MAETFTATLVNHGQSVWLKNSGGVISSFNVVGNVSAPFYIGFAKSATALGSSEVVVELQDGRTVIFDHDGKFVRIP